MDGGDLDGYLKKRYPHGMPENLARRFLCHLTDGVSHLYSNSIVHRHLNPQNLSLTDTTDFATIKITDFGFARPVPKQDLMHSILGSPLYMAPEVHHGN